MAFNPLRSISKRVTRIRQFPLLVRRKGACFILDPRNWIDNRLAAGASYEDEQLSHAARIIAEHDAETLIDVGANIGIYTVLIGRLPQIKQVLSFEPVRRNFNQLLGNVFANGLDSKVDAYRVALGDHRGQSKIHIDPTSTGLSRLDLRECKRDLSVFVHTDDVEVGRFDDLVALKDKRVFLKIDVEAQAWETLVGMEGLFKCNQVFLQVEIIESEKEAVHDLLSTYGLDFVSQIGDDCYFSPRRRQSIAADGAERMPQRSSLSRSTCEAKL